MVGVPHRPLLPSLPTHALVESEVADAGVRHVSLEDGIDLFLNFGLEVASRICEGLVTLPGYLAHKKTKPSRTLP